MQIEDGLERVIFWRVLHILCQIKVFGFYPEDWLAVDGFLRQIERLNLIGGQKHLFWGRKKKLSMRQILSRQLCKSLTFICFDIKVRQKTFCEKYYLPQPIVGYFNHSLDLLDLFLIDF